METRLREDEPDYDELAAEHEALVIRQHILEACHDFARLAQAIRQRRRPKATEPSPTTVPWDAYDNPF